MSYPGPRPPSSLGRLARPLARAAEELVFPPACVACAEPLPAMAERYEEANWFCKACLEAIEPQVPPYCSKCGEMYDGAFTNAFRCSNCEGLKLEFDFAVAACTARDPVRELIHRFKYGRRLHLRASLAVLLRRVLKEERLKNEDLAQWLLVPVPLHPEREADREFNQSWELCLRLARTHAAHGEAGAPQPPSAAGKPPRSLPAASGQMVASPLESAAGRPRAQNPPRGRCLDHRQHRQRMRPRAQE